MKVYAYARVSARDQNLERQLEAFRKFGVDARNIFSDKKSGKDFDRLNYNRLLARLRRGDLLVIQSIDRLGRDYSMITEEWRRITLTIRADILVLDMPILDTRERSDSLMGRFIADIVLQILSFVAENERANIRARQAAGIALAKQNGVRFGRPNKEYSPEFLQTVRDFYDKKLTVGSAAAKEGMSRSLFYYHARKLRSGL